VLLEVDRKSTKFSAYPDVRQPKSEKAIEIVLSHRPRFSRRTQYQNEILLAHGCQVLVLILPPEKLGERSQVLLVKSQIKDSPTENFLV